MYLCFKDLFDEAVFAGILRMLWKSMGRTFSRYYFMAVNSLQQISK